MVEKMCSANIIICLGSLIDASEHGLNQKISKFHKNDQMKSIAPKQARAKKGSSQ